MDPGAGSGTESTRTRQSTMQQPQPQLQQAYPGMTMNMAMMNGRAGSPPSHPAMLQQQQQQFLQQQRQNMQAPQLQQYPQIQSLPPHIQAQMMAAMQSGYPGSPAGTPPQHIQAVQTPPSGGFRSPSVAGMKGPVMSEEQKRNIQVDPSQMQAFIQAQARAQAQMQAQAQAAALAQQQQQRPQSGQGQILQMPMPTQQPTMPAQPQQPFFPQMPQPQQQFSPSVMNGPPNSILGTPPARQLTGPPQMPNRVDPTASNAVPGPSNFNAVPQQQARRPSMDQITLMQRLSQLAQKPGGLPIQSLFTKTSWESSTDPAASDHADLPMPTFTPLERRNVESWMQKDIQNMELSVKGKNRMRDTLEEMAQDMLAAQDWLGPPRMATGIDDLQARTLPGTGDEGKIRLRNRKEMEKDLAKGKRKTRPWLEFSKKQLREVAKIEECLIPIRLDLEHDGRKLCDTLTWNLNDKLISPALFAGILCEDLLLPVDPFHASIVASIKEQIKQYQEAEQVHPRALFMRATADSQQAVPSPSPLALQGVDPFSSAIQQMQDDIDPAEIEQDWWDGWRKKVKLAHDISVGQEMTGIPWSSDDHAEPEALPEVAPILQMQLSEETAVAPVATTAANDELRIVIQVDISVDTINLKDQFEWDLADPQSSPEDFAAVYCADLGLPGEFKTAIVHLIREQADAYARSLSSIRHIKGDPVLHDELRPAFQPPLLEVIRSADIEAWTPHLEKLGLLELEHREKERERQSRRQKRGARNNRRNVVALPDRDPLKTNRTIMPRAGAKLEMPDPNAIGEEAAVPSYQTSEPFPLEPTQNMGPPPKMASPLRRYAKLPVQPNGDSTPGVLATAGGPKAKGVQANGLPGAAAAPPKKPTGRPPKGKAGWSRSEMTTHENVIDGKWHCTNCGVPEPVAVGRRKGPAGPNTQCAECSKYWQANKGKLRPCEYSTDPSYHIARAQGFHPGLSHSRGASIASTPAPMNVDSPGSGGFDNESGDDYKPDVDSSFMTENGRPRGDSDASLYASQGRPGQAAQPLMAGKQLGGKQLPPPPIFSERPTQPRPASQTKLQPHLSIQKQNAPPMPASHSKPKASLQPPPQQQQQALPTIRLSPNRVHARIPSTSSSPHSGEAQGLPRPSAPPRKRPEPPAWLLEQMNKLRQERPDDRFEITNKPRTTPDEPIEFRVKCLDCPGKIYKPGPEETLDNFAGHLRFKGHRAAVAARMAGTAAA